VLAQSNTSIAKLWFCLLIHKENGAQGRI